MFAGELADRAHTLESGLLELEEAEPGERAAILDELARAAHTLKGSAGMMGETEVATLCHELEDAFGRLRGSETTDPELLTRLLADVDRLRAAGGADTGGIGSPTGGETGGGASTTPAGRDTRTRPGSGSRAPADESVRLPSQKLDTLVGRAGELRAVTTSLLTLSSQLTTAQDRIRDARARPGSDGAEAWGMAANLLGQLDRRVRPLLRGIDRAAAEVDTAVRDVVTVPVTEACHGLGRAVRDIAETRRKQVGLHLAVRDAEIDRGAVGVVRDALVHLVRNAVDHGIEPPAERREAGKTEEGRVEIAATVQGDRVSVVVRDDGRGVDTAAVQAAATAAGTATEAEPHELIFTAGLSTAAETTDISGRGVGLDAVRERVESLGGTVTLTSEAGRGTEVTLTVPASLATARVLLVEAAGEQVALLAGAVTRLIRVDDDDVVVADGRSWVRHDGETLALASLAQVADLPTATTSTREQGRSPAVVVAGGAGPATALLVDRVVREQELLIQPLGPPIDELPGVVGAGMLAHGTVVLLFHPSALVRSAEQRGTSLAVDTSDVRRSHRGRVLLAEDAPTTRALEQGLLEAAGYEVVPASDGRQAWDRLRQEPVDVVVTDIEMPYLDGIALCERIRNSPTLRELPVILVTSLSSDTDRRRGAEAGADAYLVKSSFAQGDLLAAIERMLG